jgi:hypothetical protein
LQQRLVYDIRSMLILMSLYLTIGIVIKEIIVGMNLIEL